MSGGNFPSNRQLLPGEGGHGQAHRGQRIADRGGSKEIGVGDDGDGELGHGQGPEERTNFEHVGFGYTAQLPTPDCSR